MNSSRRAPLITPYLGYNYLQFCIKHFFIHLLCIKPFTIHLLSFYLFQFQLCSLLTNILTQLSLALCKQVLPEINSYTLVNCTSSNSSILLRTNLLMISIGTSWYVLRSCIIIPWVVKVVILRAFLEWGNVKLGINYPAQLFEERIQGCAICTVMSCVFLDKIFG